MKHRKIETDRRKIKYVIPVNISEVTYQQYYDIMIADFDDKKTIQILTGLPEDIWEIDMGPGMLTSLQSEMSTKKNTVLNDLAGDLRNDSLVNAIMWKDEVIALPKDIGTESFVQFHALQNALKEFNKSFDEDSKVSDYKLYLKALPMIVAIYMQPKVTNKDDRRTGELVKDLDAAKVIEEKLWSYPCNEIFSIATFFLTSLKKYQNGMPKTPLVSTSLQKKFKLALLKLAIRLGVIHWFVR